MSQGNRVNVTLLAILLLALLGACSIHTEKEANGQDKKVDIKTPFAEVHVGSDTGAKDAGIAMYPGSRPKEEGQDKGRANVQIGGENLGVKVIAANYLSDDPPQKVIDFYRKDLGKYGKVLECPKGLKEDHPSHEDGELRCDDNGHAQEGHMTLAVGIPARQHVVDVKPDGKGTEFSTVFVQVKGKAGETM